MIPLRLAILCLAAGCVAGGSEVARVDLKKPPNVKHDPSQPGAVETAGGGVFDTPKPDPHRVPSLSVDIQTITKISFPGGSGSSTYLHIVLENIGTDDITLPIGVDSLNLLAAGSGRIYLTLAVKGSDPTAPDLASAKLAMNVEHPESAAKLKPGDTISIELSLGQKPQGVDPVPLTAVISLHQITTSEGVVRDEVVVPRFAPYHPSCGGEGRQWARSGVGAGDRKLVLVLPIQFPKLVLHVLESRQPQQK